jgi:uncharacterized protein (TIGR03118 family)
MTSRTKIARSITAALTLALALGSASLIAQHGKSGYVQHNLVSDGSLAADHTDANLVNAWGVAFNPNGFVWVANNHTGTSTLYDGDGNPQSLVVSIPTPSAATGGSPTGIVFNASSGFVVTGANGSGPSRFLFATEDGVIAGWAPAADTTHAIMAVDNSINNAIYKGIALSAGGSGQLLYATDFHNAKIDVFDATFTPVNFARGAFVDAGIPAGFAPFGIQAIGGNIYVTYAMQDADAEDDVHGKGLGYVDAYDPNGHLIRRIASRGVLNAPWGLALAPDGFGTFSHDLLIGNFGDGTINAFNLKNGTPAGELRGADNRPLAIDGLWGISFGNGLANQPVNTLFFAAGPNDEANGLYGRIDAQ